MFLPNVTWTKGHHTFHFGFEMHYEAKGNVAPGNAYGAFTFGKRSDAAGHRPRLHHQRRNRRLHGRGVLAAGNADQWQHR